MNASRRVTTTAEMAAGVIGQAVDELRALASRTSGVVYRLAARRPDPDVDDNVLADRIRSTIGPLARDLDIPRVNVMVEDHVALLHGDVPNSETALRVERAVLAVSGVRGIESHLHPCLASGDTRPSEGRRRRGGSDARRALVDAARGAGANDPEAAVHAVLCGFADRLPAAERAHVFAHLPADVRVLAGPPRRAGVRPARHKRLHQLLAVIVAEHGVEPPRAEAITRAVVAALRELVPEERRDVAAVLPAELRELWDTEPRSPC